jgi:steroid 5-alpha reductase family enzyme
VVPLLFIALGIAVTYFAIVWAISVRIKNYGLLDVAWSYGVAILSPLYAAYGPGLLERRVAFTVVGTLWSLRLGTYILRRVLRHHPQEDKRYEVLRKKWPGAGMFLLFFELQAILVVIFSLPYLFAAYNTTKHLQLAEMIGLSLALFALIGEVTADHQMKSFKANPANEGRICQSGLWHYSRHPNYFFEAVFWFAIALAAWPSPWGWISLACPLLMLQFLLKVTGIALTEEYTIKSKGDAYRNYQRTTSAFIPWFRKQL